MLLATGTTVLSRDNDPVPVSQSKSDIQVKEVSLIRLEPDFIIPEVIQKGKQAKGIIGYSQKGRPVEAWYFPGKTDRRALVIGGVHGSELSAIEVAKTVITQLRNDPSTYYSVIVIPCLFPDNMQAAEGNPLQIGSTGNIGRYSHADAPDPNRQMPALGNGFDDDDPFDHAGRKIEPENQLLLQIIQQFQPQRIANLHAIRAMDQAGIYADPRTDSKGYAHEYESDSTLAIGMAQFIEENGGGAPGNTIYTRPTTLYRCDPPVAEPGQKQKRNLHGSRLPGNRGYGVSLGSWAATAVYDPVHHQFDRPAIRILTVEFPGCKRPEDYYELSHQQQCRKQISLYAGAITSVFLADFQTEN
jgi:hypothetical protein